MIYRGLFDRPDDGPDSIWLFEPDTNSWTWDLGRMPTGTTWDGAICWDATTGRILSFGGGNIPTLQPWTFGWDPGTETWEVISTVGPPERRGHTMVFDEASGKVVLFGGVDADGNLLGDTWEWSGSEWNQRSDDAVMARENAAMAYDPARGGVVLFGGRGTLLRNDTWLWNTVVGAWIPIAFVNPPAREAHAMAYDPVDAGILLYGGSSDSTARMSDIWFLPSGSTVWTQVAANSPAGARREHVMVTRASEDRIYLFGGEGAGRALGDIWRWNGAGSGWESLDRPGTGLSLSAYSRVAVDPVSGTAFMFGGLGDEGRIWRWNQTTGAWNLLDALGPGARQGHVFLYDEHSGKILLYGGLTTGLGVSNDTWFFDPATETWTQIEEDAPPGLCYNAAFTYDPISQRVMVYGGWTPSDDANTETWAWDGLTNEWTMLRFEGNGNRIGPTLGFDQGTNELLLYRDNKIHLWDHDNNAWIDQGANEIPAERRYATMVYSNLIGQLMFIGGETGMGWMNDVLLRDPDTGLWARLALENSTKRGVWPSAVELPSDQTILLQAGRTYTWRCPDPYYCRADVNSDHSLDFFDIAQYLQWFSEGDERADLASPRWVLDFFDVSEYLNYFSDGCP
jgi:N-acetylneuraminic acid mutarotase